MNERGSIFGRLTLGLCSIVVASMLSEAARAQDLTAERRRVLATVGHLDEQESWPLAPTSGMGLVFKQPIHEPGAKSLALHFEITRPGAGWRIQVKKGDVVKWRISDDEVEGSDFWSDDIDGGDATIELYSARAANSVQMIVHAAEGADLPVPSSITGANNLQAIGGQVGWIVTAGGSVARLRFVGDDGGMYVCTAFLISPEIMLTNNHCIATDSERKSAKVDFDYDTAGATPQTVRLKALLKTDFALDYSVVRLATASNRAPLALLRERPQNGAKLVIVEHPGGQPKQVSIQDCVASPAETPGRGGGPTDFGHQCDTLGGASGSPVILFQSHKVLGLHHLGFDPAGGSLFNRAVHMDLILDDLGPTIRTELGLPP